MLFPSASVVPHEKFAVIWTASPVYAFHLSHSLKKFFLGSGCSSVVESIQGLGSILSSKGEKTVFSFFFFFNPPSFSPKRIFLTFTVYKFDMMCSGVNFFGFFLLGVLSASSICRCMSFAKFGESSAMTSAPTSFSSPSGIVMIWMLRLLSQFQQPLRRCSFFFTSVHFPLPRLGNFYIQVHGFFPKKL